MEPPVPLDGRVQLNAHRVLEPNLVYSAGVQQHGLQTLARRQRCSWAWATGRRSGQHLLVFVDGGAPGGGHTDSRRVVEVVWPMKPLTGTTAEDLHDTLFLRFRMQPITKFKDKFFVLSKSVFVICEAEDSSGNDGLYHGDLPQTPQNTFGEFSFCRNHHTHLITA